MSFPGCGGAAGGIIALGWDSFLAYWLTGGCRTASSYDGGGLKPPAEEVAGPAEKYEKEAGRSGALADPI